jgi:Mg-chelatase subunit ChlD
MVLAWGDQEAAERVRESASLYNTGVRVNELCEEVLAKRPEIVKNPATRETVVDICQRHRWMSVSEVTEAFARLFDAAAVPTEAKDMGRPQEPPVARVVAAPGQRGPPAPKAVVFCLDWSASMMSRDTRTPHSRFELCQASVQKILQEQVHDADLVGVVGFGPNVQIVCPPTSKKTGSQNLTAQIASLKPQSQGGTCFYDAVATSLKILGQPALVPLDGMRWVICLTDGDDLGSQRGNQSGELVTQMLQSSGLANLNMVMITVGPMKQQNLQIMDSWVNHVTGAGGQGMRISETDAVNITKAFEVVAEYLAADVGGAVEC